MAQGLGQATELGFQIRALFGGRHEQSPKERRSDAEHRDSPLGVHQHGPRIPDVGGPPRLQHPSTDDPDPAQEACRQGRLAAQVVDDRVQSGRTAVEAWKSQAQGSALAVDLDRP
ncbi:MAG: hypothetical protein AAGD10_12650 [Myxococcota bacterium]